MKTRRNAKGGLTVKGVVGTWGSAAPSWDVVEAAALAADALPTAEKRRTAWAEVWRDAQLAAGAGQASTPKGTAKGQIAHLAEGLPPGSKRGVLIALLAYRWDEFREYLVAAAGWAESKLPVRPSAGLALTQIEHVVDWVAELEAASAAADVGGTSTSKSLDDFGA